MFVPTVGALRFNQVAGHRSSSYYRKKGGLRAGELCPRVNKMWVLHFGLGLDGLTSDWIEARYITFREEPKWMVDVASKCSATTF